MKTLNDFPMGAPAKDVVTGFKGTITGKIEYMTGCSQVCLLPYAEKNKAADSAWFDITRVAVLGVVPKEIKEVLNAGSTNKGGPQDTPTGNMGPS